MRPTNSFHHPSVILLAVAMVCQTALADPLRTGDGGVSVLGDAVLVGGSIANPFSLTQIDSETGLPLEAPVSFQVTGAIGGAAQALDADTPSSHDLLAGYAASIFEVTSLELAATPATLANGESSTLVLTAVLHDGSRIVVDPRTAGWQKTGPVTTVAVTAAGPKEPATASVTAESVASNTPATVEATFFLPSPAIAPLTVEGSSPDIGIAQSWLTTHEISVFHPMDDADKDGMPDVFEAAFNLNPSVSDGAAAMAFGIHEEGGQKYLKMSYRHHTGHSGIQLLPQRGTDLGENDWTNEGIVPVGSPEAIDAETERITVRSTTPMNQTREFMRLKATYTAPSPAP